MNRDSWIVVCLAYIIGLLATGLFYFDRDLFSWLVVLKVVITLVIFCTIGKLFIKERLNNQIWFSAILVAILAVVYLSFRIPQPTKNDLSYLITSEKSQTAIVTGKVITEPRLNSNQKLKFWLQAERVVIKDSNTSQSVSGKLYVTIPLLQGNKIFPRQRLTIEGALYKPKIPNNPQQFNFQRYLKERGIFAGLAGWNITEKSESKWGWYRLRKRIIRAQVKGLGSPYGQLVSSMVLGRKAVDLPEDIRLLFVKSGLAHVLAASGFHVALLLGIILKLTNFLDEKKQVIIGIVTLVTYVFLTGFSPSVIRAALMGIAVLIAIAYKARVRPLGSLLLVATLLLLVNPLWIWDLGFQLSFLATFGIVVSLPILVTRLDWLPSNIANGVAVPLAASIWVLPLVIYTFQVVATYSILVNIITTPLVTIISLGGMLASAIALLIPTIGSYLAWLLKYPILLLIELLKFFTNLPGSNLAVGNISLWLLAIIYSILLFIWLDRRLQKYWWICILLVVGLMVVPLRYQQAKLLQIAILNTNDIPSIVIQDRGRVILINNGDKRAIKYTIMPFLFSQGINQIDYLAMTLEQAQKEIINLAQIQSQTTIKKLVIYGDRTLFKPINKTTIPVEFNSSITTHSLKIESINDSEIIQLTTPQNRWLLTDKLASLNYLKSQPQDILIWFGDSLSDRIFNTFNGKIAIAENINIESSSTKSDRAWQIYTTNRQGTIIWTPQTGFTFVTENLKSNNFW